jgi:hypothetical protein
VCPLRSPNTCTLRWGRHSSPAMDHSQVTSKPEYRLAAWWRLTAPSRLKRTPRRASCPEPRWSCNGWSGPSIRERRPEPAGLAYPASGSGGSGLHPAPRPDGPRHWQRRRTDLPGALWQLRLLEAHAAAFTHRSGREQLDDVYRLDPLRPRFQIAEDVPHPLLRGIDIDGLLKAQWGTVTSKVAHSTPVMGSVSALEDCP